MDGFVIFLAIWVLGGFFAHAMIITIRNKDGGKWGTADTLIVLLGYAAGPFALVGFVIGNLIWEVSK